MSVKVMNAVFDRYPNGGGEMLLALALADHAHENGRHIFPSVEHLAEKTRQSVRSVQYQLRRMQDAGWLILVNSGNGGRQLHSEYRISLEWINGAEIAPFKNDANDGVKGAIHDKKGCNPQQKRVQPVAPVNNRHRTVSEPSVTVIGADAPKTKRATVLPNDFQPDQTAETLAQELGVNADNELAAFCDHHSAKGTTFKDWQAGFRTWLRNARKFQQQRQGTAPRIAPAPKSFAQSDKENGWARWEQMAGRPHPDRLAQQQAHNVIDITPHDTQRRLEG